MKIKTTEMAKSKKKTDAFRGKLGTGTRFKNCVKKLGSAKLCASIGRKKYGKKRFAKLG